MSQTITVDFTVQRYNPETQRTETLVSDGFNCEELRVAAEALERAARVLRRGQA
jgi:hypothetical protein